MSARASLKKERGNIQMITMKLFFHLCFLVLVTSSVTRGKNTTDVPDVEEPKAEPKEISSDDQIQNKTTVSPENEVYGKESETPKPLTTQQLLNGSNNETTTPTAPAPSPPTATEGGSKDKEVTSAGAAPAAAASSKAGYVILVLIIIVIIILCTILYMLRRASRSYSFDLQRPPSSRLDEPTGTFGQVYLDDLAPKGMETTDDLPTAPVANGTGPQMEDKDTREDKNTSEVSREQPEANGVQNSPPSSASSSLGDDQSEQASNQLSSNNLLFDAMEEPQQQNENNNNPSACSSIPFVEINLDEPAWCDQFLTSTQPTSSVYPVSFSSAS
nr:uncharacterized protein LOC107376794 isoform X1 [Nothobranchius furzeri]